MPLRNNPTADQSGSDRLGLLTELLDEATPSSARLLLSVEAILTRFDSYDGELR